jgi:hypothetical protein
MSANDLPREMVFTRQTGPGELTKVIIEYLQFGEVHIGEEFWDSDEFVKYTKTGNDEATVYNRDGNPYFCTNYEPDEIAIVITKEVVK